MCGGGGGGGGRGVERNTRKRKLKRLLFVGCLTFQEHDCEF